jgi:hypothetical protein
MWESDAIMQSAWKMLAKNKHEKPQKTHRPYKHKMCVNYILYGTFLSPLIHDLNLPFLEALRLGAGPEEGGEAQKMVVSAHGNEQK